ncbi:MAG: type II toxin-antitoxin system RelE/ParE family toxin [Chloroflexota bacterium]
MSIQTPTYKQVIHEIKDTPVEYLPNLLEIIRLFRESVTLKPAPASLKQGWKELKAGNTHPVSKLWEDIQKGKRSGYRLIYHLKTSRSIILVTIYSKLEQSDISAEQIRRIVNEFDGLSS